MASSPSIREFARVDDAAIFIEDTFDADTVRSIAGTSPSAVVMLSPQRMPVDKDGHSPAKQNAAPGLETGHATTYVSGLSDSARKRPNTVTGNRLFGTDLSNVGVGSGVGSATTSVAGGGGGGSASNIQRSPSSASSGPLRAFGSRLNFSACTTPKDPRKGSVTRPAIQGRRASSAGEAEAAAAAAAALEVGSGHGRGDGPSAESLADILTRYVPIEEFEKLEKERNRYREMYRYQAQLCEELTKREAEAQNAVQDKIVEIIALSSRNEESKRFIRQMKREMQECRERALPFLNQKLDDTRIEQSLKHKYETMLRTQESIFEAEKAEMEKEMGALEALLKDTRCAASIGKNSDSLLRASYLKNTRMFNDLYHVRRERDAEVERRLDLERQLEACRKERRDMEFTLSKERRMHSQREEQLIEDVHVMHEEVMALTNELLEVQIQRDAESQAAAERERQLDDEAEAFRQEIRRGNNVENNDDDEDESFVPTVVDEQSTCIATEDDSHLKTPPNTPSIPPRPARRPFAVPQ